MVLREQATQLSLKHERYKETARLNEAAGAEVESVLLKMEQRTKVRLRANPSTNPSLSPTLSFLSIQRQLRRSMVLLTSMYLFCVVASITSPGHIF